MCKGDCVSPVKARSFERGQQPFFVKRSLTRMLRTPLTYFFLDLEAFLAPPIL
jgi:hypothetical protein